MSVALNNFVGFYCRSIQYFYDIRRSQVSSVKFICTTYAELFTKFYF